MRCTVQQQSSVQFSAVTCRAPFPPDPSLFPLFPLFPSLTIRLIAGYTTSLHYTSNHTWLFCIVLKWSALHCTALHWTALHCTALHCFVHYTLPYCISVLFPPLAPCGRRVHDGVRHYTDPGTLMYRYTPKYFALQRMLYNKHKLLFIQITLTW